MMALNYWHFVVFGVLFLILLFGIYASLKQPVKKLRTPMILSITLIVTLIGGFSVVVVDKYTKKASLHKFKNKRILSIEKIVYTGIVKNDGKFPIGEVSIEIKIVNKGHATGNVKGGNFYQASGFMDFFSSGADILYKPQSITKQFVVAKNLKPGQAKAFRVYFDYPPYFKQVSQFAKLYSH